MIDFNGKTALVTGGSRGIGRATATLFASLGANVAITYQKDHASAEATKSEIQGMGRQAIARAIETTDEKGMDTLCDEIATSWTSLDCLVINAGIWNEAALADMSLATFREMMEINMAGTFVAAKSAARSMQRQRSGSIVIISSTAGQRGESLHSHYAASKGAQISFTKSLAVELAPFGIRVNCVAPGWVETEMTAQALEDPTTMEDIRRVIPLARVAQPTEIANAIAFLSSDAASFITGEILNINGGAVLCG